MAVDFRSIGQVQVWSSATSATFSCPQPPGLAVGDLMVAAVLTNGVSIDLPAGWTGLYNLTAAGNPNQRVFYKVADATDVSTATFAFTTSTATYGSAEICAYTGVDQTNPIDFTCTPVDSSASLTAFTITAATVVTEGAVLIGGAGANTGVTTQVWTQPTSPGQWVDEWNPATGAGGATSASGGKSHVRGHYLTPLAAGSSTGSVTFTLSVSRAGDAWFAGLRPGGGGGAVTPTLLTRVVGVGGSPTTGRVMARVSNATAARLKVGTDTAVTTGVIEGPSVTPDGEGSAHLTVSGLTPGTRYYYRVVMTDSDGGEHDDTATTIGSLRTAPTGAASFNIDFASCTDSTDSDSMAAVGARDDDLFLHLGDLYYADGSGTGLANVKSKMLAKVSAANHQAVFATRPVVYIPSDHDGMNNNSTAGTDPTAWTNWNTAYREYFPTPALPAVGCYYTFTWGRVRFVVMDTQSFKMDPSTAESSTKTSLGTTQKQWIKDTIDAATEPVIVIVNAQPWIGAPISGDDSWLGFTTERAEMAAFFQGTGKNIVLTGGDQHCLAADDGSNSPGGVPIFHAAPLNNTASRKGGPYSAGQYPASGSSLVQQYGRLAVTDDGSQISLAYTGYDSTNVAHITLTKTYQTGEPPPAMPTGDLPPDAIAPSGWTQILAEDFDTDCAQGDFLTTYPGWIAYPDTWDNGHTSYYNGGNSIAVSAGVLSMQLFTDETGKPRTETIQPPNGQGGQQQYGIYEIAYRVPAPIPGYKQAFLLWPLSNDGRDGEIDFPEASFDSGQPIAGFVHEVEPPGLHVNNAYSENSGVPATDGQWHVCRTVWRGDTVEFWLDGARLGAGYQSSINVPDIIMTWKLQTEGNLTGTFADPGIDPATTGELELAYAVAYTPVSVIAPTDVTTTSLTSSPAVTAPAIAVPVVAPLDLTTSAAVSNPAVDAPVLPVPVITPVNLTSHVATSSPTISSPILPIPTVTPQGITTATTTTSPAVVAPDIPIPVLSPQAVTTGAVTSSPAVSTQTTLQPGAVVSLASLSHPGIDAPTLGVPRVRPKAVTTKATTSSPAVAAPVLPIPVLIPGPVSSSAATSSPAVTGPDIAIPVIAPEALRNATLTSSPTVTAPALAVPTIQPLDVLRNATVTGNPAVEAPTVGMPRIRPVSLLTHAVTSPASVVMLPRIVPSDLTSHATQTNPAISVHVWDLPSCGTLTPVTLPLTLTPVEE